MAITYLGQKGYTIYKKNIDISEQVILRRELEVSPWVPKNSPFRPPSFPIYRESKQKLYIPRFHGIDNYGKPEEVRISEGKNINVKFVGTLRPHQTEAVKAFMESNCGCGLL